MLGVDTAIEAVGAPATLLLGETLAAPGGTIATIDGHGQKLELPIENR